MIKRSLYAFLLLAVALVSQYCANIVAPSGGPKDNDPPVLKECSPENLSPNFTSPKIIITFDEYIQLKNLNQELIISPPLEEKPEIFVRGKNLIIDLVLKKNTLKENSTYQFNFGNSIADINEGKILENFKYVFSTGDYVDSLMIEGRVFNAFDLQKAEEGMVMIYSNYEDSTPLLDIPEYITRINDEGNFSLTNIRPAEYRIFALKDANSNMIFDQPAEHIAYIDSLIIPFVESKVQTDTLTDSLGVDSIITREKVKYGPLDIALYMFEEDYHKQYLKESTRPEQGKLVFVFNRDVKEEVRFKPIYQIADDPWLILEGVPENDTLTYWITDTSLYRQDTISIERVYPRTDSLGNIEITTDTSSVKYKSNAESKKKKKNEPEKDTLTIASNLTKELDFFNDGILTLSHPAKEYDLDKIKLYKVVDTVENPVEFEFFKDSSNLLKYHIDFPWEFGMKYKLFADRAAFTDIYDLINDTLDVSFIIVEKEKYSKIILDLVTSEKQILVQLLDANERVLKEKRKNSDNLINFEYLKPGKYSLKAIWDQNENNLWDTGNYLKNIQPEKVSFYNGEVETKPNWDIEVKWELIEYQPPTVTKAKKKK